MVSLSSKIQSQLLPAWPGHTSLSFLALPWMKDILTGVWVPPIPNNHGNQHWNETETSRQFISTFNGHILILGFPGGHSKIFHVCVTVAWYSLYPKLKASGLCGIQRSSLQTLQLKFYLPIFKFTSGFQNSKGCLQTPFLETLLWFCKHFQF